MVYGTQITIVFMGFLLTNYHHWGPHIVLNITDTEFRSASNQVGVR
jgi:hypothetical protein